VARQDEPDVRLKVGFFNHPKTLRVERDLGSDGVLCLIRLLMFARVNRHKDGSFSGLTDEDIEAAAGWHRCERYANGMLVACLSHAGFLDGEIGERKIHEWKDHQAFAANFHKRSKAGKANATARWDKTYDRPNPHPNRIPLASEPHANRNAPTPTPTPMGRRGESEGGSGLDAPHATIRQKDPILDLTPEETRARIARIVAEEEADRAARAARNGRITL
jgi:hypothetical protein